MSKRRLVVALREALSDPYVLEVLADGALENARLSEAEADRLVDDGTLDGVLDLLFEGIDRVIDEEDAKCG